MGRSMDIRLTKTYYRYIKSFSSVTAPLPEQEPWHTFTRTIRRQGINANAHIPTLLRTLGTAENLLLEINWLKHAAWVRFFICLLIAIGLRCVLISLNDTSYIFDLTDFALILTSSMVALLILKHFLKQLPDHWCLNSKTQLTQHFFHWMNALLFDRMEVHHEIAFKDEFAQLKLQERRDGINRQPQRQTHLVLWSDEMALRTQHQVKTKMGLLPLNDILMISLLAPGWCGFPLIQWMAQYVG